MTGPGRWDEPVELRVTGLVRELGAVKFLEYTSRPPGGIGHDLARDRHRLQFPDRPPSFAFNWMSVSFAARSIAFTMS